MNDGNAKQQIVEKIKNSSNILVTVSANPSVDELSAALGLTLLLNKMKKHATAVFSGAIPPAITFLDPQKTFENTVDSLRDFIIALDKEKADHLRYKVEGEVVKIFITPYRTTITSDDLDFSQGDYNVELVLALGVKKRDNLDSALTAHGRILHDATVATMSVGEKSELGSIDWRDENASSLSEMLVSLTEAFKDDKSLLDEQIATAFLTGIVAATNRFSNNHTSSRVMTMAAQLMAAGANQQLIAAKLEDANEIGVSNSNDQARPSGHSDGTTDLSEGESTKLDKQPAPSQVPAEPKKDDGSLEISHDADSRIDEVAMETAAKQQEEAVKAAEETLAQQLPPVMTSAATPSLDDLQKDLAAEAANREESTPAAPSVSEAPQIISQPAPLSGAVSNDVWQNNDTPSMGGTLNATAEQAADDKRKAEENDRNHTILTHNNSEYIGDSAPTYQSPLNAASMPSEEPPLSSMFIETPVPGDTTTAPTYAAATIQPPASITEPVITPPTTTLADIDKQNREPHEEARAAIDAAFGAVPFTPDNSPQAATGAQFMGEVSHDAPVAVPPMPPLPDFSTLPPLPPLENAPAPQDTSLPPEKLEDMFSPAPAAPQQPQSNDPGQFKIPGQ